MPQVRRGPVQRDPDAAVVGVGVLAATVQILAHRHLAEHAQAWIAVLRVQVHVLVGVHAAVHHHGRPHGQLQVPPVEGRELEQGDQVGVEPQVHHGLGLPPVPRGGPQVVGIHLRVQPLEGVARGDPDLPQLPGPAVARRAPGHRQPVLHNPFVDGVLPRLTLLVPREVEGEEDVPHPRRPVVHHRLRGVEPGHAPLVSGLHLRVSVHRDQRKGTHGQEHEEDQQHEHEGSARVYPTTGPHGRSSQRGSPCSRLRGLTTTGVREKSPCWIR
ncbi:hypothetical protein HRbin32_01033 [bacterium HR32]|nr:hypothetical protein HRbin32_01033 [bacterium HR32]